MRPLECDRDDSNYNSFDDLASSEYRGFSTSINDLFNNPENERVDCCSLALCGILQSDRNRFLVSGTKPPSCLRRVGLHVLFPCWILALALTAALNVPDPFLNSVLSTGFVFCLFGYFVIQCKKGSWKRLDTRRDLLRSKYNLIANGHFRPRSNDEEDSMGDESQDDENLEYMMGQTKSDLRNSHALCGCYRTDRPADYRFQPNAKANFCTRIFQCFTQCCCGLACKMHMQCCGICAIAQEARQLENLLPEGYKQIDYVTGQPVMEYYAAIYRHRHGEDNSSNWWQRLSDLSKSILWFCCGTSVLLFIWSCLSSVIHHNFGFANFLVFCATLLQSVILLMLVQRNYTRDISLDALVKYFASGFCLSTSLAVFFEVVVGLTVRLTMKCLIAMSGVDEVEGNGYGHNSLTNSGFASQILMDATRSASASYKEYVHTYGKEHPVVYAVYLLITSFLLAAMIEELCKYFGYRMADHPDFYSQSKLEEAAECQGTENRDEQTFSQQGRSLQSHGAAITIAMIATSLGFACCENFVYVFIYGGKTVGVRIGVLLARSLLPIHPIAAALQSVRVCQRDLEKDEGMRLGRIILPAVLLHGIYDFLLTWIDFMYELHGNYVVDDDEPFTDERNSNLVSISVSFGVLFLGSWYYLRAAGKQRERLKAMDMQSIDASRLI